MEYKHLPSEWKIVPVREVTVPTSQRDPGKQPDTTFQYVDVSSVDNTLFKILSVTELKGSEAPSRARKDIRCNDVLFATVRPTLKRVALVPPGLDGEVASTGYCILRPNADRIEAGFLYNCVLSDEFIDGMRKLERGASYPAVRDSDVFGAQIPLPPLAEQRKIAEVLAVVRRAIEQHDRLIQLTTELKKTLLEHLFTQGLHAEIQKQTEIGPIPESWEVVDLSRAVEQIDYGISAPIPKTPPENGVKIVSTADITKDGRLLYGKIRQITAPEKTVKRLTLQTGDVLFNWRNSAELIGKSAVFREQDEPHVFASFILRIKCDEKKFHNFFLAHLMNHFREKEVFLKLARRAVNQANYNRNEISVLRIPLPTYAEQQAIADSIRVVDARIDQYRQKKEKLAQLCRTMLHQLMTAQIRVHYLDLPEQEAVATE